MVPCDLNLSNRFVSTYASMGKKSHGYQKVHVFLSVFKCPQHVRLGKRNGCQDVCHGGCLHRIASFAFLLLPSSVGNQGDWHRLDFLLFMETFDEVS